MTFAALIAAALREPEVRAALREALAAPSTDEWIPLARAAAEIGVRPRVLRDAARRGRLDVAGPRSARVIRRTELDRFLRANAIAEDRPVDLADERAAARAAVERAARRAASRPAGRSA